MNRTLKISQIFGQLYVLFVFSFIIFMYFDMYHIFQPNFFSWQDKALTNLYFFVFNVLFGMLVWCLVRTMISDPGKIPTYWGLYLDDPEHKKRRYCLICHIFKPERCHHCSICGRCVLNMDHHCPWLNNCIGFQNRKFFFLLIFYVNVTVWYVIGGLLPFVYAIIQRLFNSEDFEFSSLLVLIPFAIFIPFAYVIFNFFSFHVTLVTRNMTTLEHMDRERNKEPLDSPSTFDIDLTHNWQQVFGTNKLLWPFPLFGESGKPVGGGVTFKHRSEQMSNNQQQHNQQEKASNVDRVTVTEQNDTQNTTHNLNNNNNTSSNQLIQKNVVPPQFGKPQSQLSIQSHQRLQSSQVSEPMDTRQSYQAGMNDNPLTSQQERYSTNAFGQAASLQFNLQQQQQFTIQSATKQH